MRETETEEQKEDKRISNFLALVAPVVVKYVTMLLESAGFEVKKQGIGFDTSLVVSKDNRQAKMYLENLFLEIATIDRDEKPLRFDGRLKDFDFFLEKTVNLTKSKLKVLFHLFAEEDMDAVIENISREAKDYERIRIWQFDPIRNNTSNGVDRKNQASQENQYQ